MILFKQGLNSIITKVGSYKLSEKNIDSVLKEFHIFLLKNSVGMEVSKSITQLTKEKVLGERIKRFSNMKDILSGPLRESVQDILTPDYSINLIKIIQERREKKL